jgi:hypothetical protein
MPQAATDEELANCTVLPRYLLLRLKPRQVAAQQWHELLPDDI